MADLPCHEIVVTERKRKKNKTINDEYNHLPEVVVFEILYRVPVKFLMRFGSVCKHWYNSIHRDQHFISSHFTQYTQKHPRLIFHLPRIYRNMNNIFVDPCHGDFFRSFFYFNEDEDECVNIAGDVHQNPPLDNDYGYGIRVVGYCNGLICINQSGDQNVISKVWIWNNATNESLAIFPPDLETYFTMNFGFGFDSVNNEYKVVYIIVHTWPSWKKKGLVLTLRQGTISWTEFIIPMDYPHVCPYKLAVFSSNNGPTLFWRTDDKNLLLSFDFRRDDDPFQLIRVPVECENQLAYKSTVYRHEYEYPLVHLLEFAGCLCLARLESLTPMDHPPQDHENNNTWKMVHLYVLQDNVEGVWNKQLS